MRRLGFLVMAVAVAMAVPIVVALVRDSERESTVDTNGMSAGQLLAALEVTAEAGGPRYDRESFDYPGGGVDLRGCNTRERVLIRDSVEPAQVDPYGCKVLAGRWVDPYTGAPLTDPAEASIDHVVALSEAWRSGAFEWSNERRVRFANDVDHRDTLVVISGSGNSRKGDKDPAEWTPVDPDRRTAYLERWLAVKVRWGLSADQGEVDAIRTALAPL